MEDGSLQRNGGVKLVRAVEQLRLPQTVQGILASRIDRLPGDEKDLLQTLAVIGKEFPLALAREVFKKPDDELGRMLNDLQLAEFIYEQPAVGDIEYTFKHALTRQVAYDSLLVERRRQIHDRTARAIETLKVQQLEDHYGVLARHYLRGTDVSSALRYTRLAADQAVSRAAYPEAASMLDAALKQLERLPIGAERLRAEMTLRSIESAAAFAVYGGASTERERAITRMCELGEEIGEADQMLEGLTALSSLYLVRGECARGFELTTRCLELAEPTRDAEVLLDIRWNRALLAEFGGNLQPAVPMLEDGLAYAERSNRRYSRDGFLFRTTFKINLAQAFQLLGRDADATKLAEEGLQHARDSKHLFSICFALTNQYRAVVRRELEMVRAYTEEGIALSEKCGFAQWLAAGRVYHGWAVAKLGQLQAGVEEMEKGVATFRRAGGFPREQYAIALLAHAYAGMGRSGQALPMLNGALAHIERTGQKAEHAEMLRLRGEVLLMSDGAGTQEAENCFRAALQVARAQEARWWELRATTSLGRLLRDTNRRDEARAMLAEIYDWFSQGFDTADLKDAKALLEELST